MFEDGFISKRIPDILNIIDTCVLHGDLYQLFNEVWPTTANFGKKTFTLIKYHLKVSHQSKCRVGFLVCSTYDRYPNKSYNN